MTTRIRHLLLVLFIFSLIPIVTHAAIYNPTSVATFQDALTAAAASPEEDIINLPAGTLVPTETFFYPAPRLAPTGSLVIQGPSPTNQTIINGNGTFSLLCIDYWYNCCSLEIPQEQWGPAYDIGTTLTIRNISFQNGHYPDEGYHDR